MGKWQNSPGGTGRGRPSRRMAGALLALTGLLGMSGCALMGVATEDVYTDEFLAELRDTLEASQLVSHTQVEPEFYERAENIPPRNATVELAPTAQASDLPALLVELTAVAEKHGEDVPRLDFTPLPAPTASLTFSGSVDIDEAEELIGYILDGDWIGPVVHVPKAGEPRLRTTAAIDSIDQLSALAEVTTAPLPSTIPADSVVQWLAIENPHMVTEARVAGIRMTPEFMAALLEMDATDELLQEGMPIPSIDVGYASSSDGYIHRASLGVRVDDYEHLERDEIRQRAEADGYAAMCDELAEILSEVPDLQTSSAGCRVNSVPI